MPADPQDDRAATVAALAEQISSLTGSVPAAPRARPGRGREDAGTSPDRLHPADGPGPVDGADPVAGPDPAVAAKARDIVYRQLAAAPRSRAALAEKLRAKDIPSDTAASVLDRFERAGLIDDRAYAEAFVRAKHRDRALGRRALRAELRRHGVADSDIAAAVELLDVDDEAARAAALIDKRIGSAMAAGAEAARRRLLGLLARRGYPADLATRVVEDAIDGYQQER